MHSLNARASHLFKKYYSKTATPEETRELFELLKSTSDDGLIALMREEWENSGEAEPLFQSEKSMQMLNKILPVTEEQNGRKAHLVVNNYISWPFIYRRISVAAAIIILISTGLYFWKKPMSVSQTKIASAPVFQDIPPGGNKAVLTLSNGKTIILDSAKNGIIAKTANFEVNKTKNGQLVYHSFDRNYKNARNADFNIITTPRGGEYRVDLPDGSKVWLNAASSIKFPGVFRGKTRVIELEGEAYFEIAKNPSKPFIVSSNGAKIEVLGTHFNVRAYNNEKEIKTTLLEGSVKISGGNQSKLLKPGQQAVITGAQMKVLSDVDTEEQIAWKNGLFQFKDAGLEDVMQQAALWYDLNVNYEGKIPKKYFTGKVSRHVNASEFINMLKYTGVKFKMEGKNIIIIN